MSYILLALGLYYVTYANVLGLVQVINAVLTAYLQRYFNVSFKSALRYWALALVFTIGAFYVNHWPTL